MKLEPIVTRNSGKIDTGDNNYSTNRKNKTIAIVFLNQGAVSNVTVKFGGSSVLLVPGASYRWSYDYPYIDETNYEYEFSLGTGAGARIDLIKIIETRIVS